MKVISVLLCMAVLMSVVACGSSVSNESNGMTADEILSNCHNASNSMNTVQIHEIYTTNRLWFSGSGDTSALIDNLNHSAYTVAYDSAFPNESMEVYALDEWLYTRNSTEEWIKTQLTEDIWNSIYGSPQQQLLVTLQNYTQASYISMESVDGTNCYKIDITPTESQMNALGLSGLTIKIPTFNAWIAENNYYLMKLSFNLTISDGEWLSEILTYSNINQPVNITLPAAAENAEALSATEWMEESWRWQ
ncbi:MAG: hypothetical protein WC562_00540 [Dehalococcoidia bacterium]